MSCRMGFPIYKIGLAACTNSNIEVQWPLNGNIFLKPTTPKGIPTR